MRCQARVALALFGFWLAVWVCCGDVSAHTKKHQTATAGGNSAGSAASNSSAKTRHRRRTATTAGAASSTSGASGRKGRGRLAKGRHGRAGELTKGGADKTARMAKQPEAPPAEKSSEYQVQLKGYTLMDQAVNSRLSGNYAQSIEELQKALDVVDNYKVSPSLLARMQFELGLAAQGARRNDLAVSAFEHCLMLDSRYTDASAHLASLLFVRGQAALALVKARDSVGRNPNDARAHLNLSLVLEKAGFPSDARVERAKADQLLHGVGRVPSDNPPGSVPPVTAPSFTPTSSDENRSSQGEAEPNPPKSEVPGNGALMENPPVETGPTAPTPGPGNSQPKEDEAGSAPKSNP